MKTRTMITATVSAIAIGSIAAAGTMFDTTTKDLGGNQFQLVDTFTINYNLDTMYFDTDLNGTVDSTDDSSGEPWATDGYDGFYVDPENYVLNFGSDIYFQESQMTTSGTIDWSLSHTSTPGDASTVLSTILFGTMTGNILSVRDGLEWPVSGSGAPVGRAGFAINDFDSFTWDGANGTLAANVVPGPFSMLALAGFGMARRRRNR